VTTAGSRFHTDQPAMRRPSERDWGNPPEGRITCLDERAGAAPVPWHRTGSIDRGCVIGRS
jgi:hypothetical protein